MTMPFRCLGALLLTCLGVHLALAQQPPTKPPPQPPVTEKLPLTGLPPSKLMPDLCLLTYRIGTTSKECQAHFDQGLGFFYSYVWMEAARSFETACKYDPDCALAWWGLSRALERWGRQSHNDALKKAQELLPKASHREQQLITARLQEKGMAAGAGDVAARKKAATATIDNMITLYDDDEEAWYYRAQLAGGEGGFGGVTAAVPFYKALLRINPLHPGANHELVHYYERAQRPALGWPYAEKYIESSPGIPHAFHMQAHLATRVGKWDKTSDRSARAIELHKAYQKFMDVKPNQDAQFSHHLEIVTISLIHDGRFREARAIKAEALGNGIRLTSHWFRLHLAERDWTEALKIADQQRKSDKVGAAYMEALVYLRQGEPIRARTAVEVLQQAYQQRKNDPLLEDRLWETQGTLMCQTGAADAGLPLLQKAVKRTKDNYNHHAWGNGAYFMEAWGIAALKSGRYEIAEEAFLEALAHDPGSARAAMGMQILCERQDRGEEAQRFAELARKCWRRAEVGTFMAELDYLREDYLAVEKLTPPSQDN